VRDVVVVAATRVEARAARRALPGLAVVRTGIALQRLRGGVPATVLLSCGLCGALSRDLPPGTVVVPRRVGLPDGRSFDCDPELTDALTAGARRLGLQVDCRPMLTAATLVTGSERPRLAAEGWATADMETAHLACAGTAVAAVRVVLDTPDRELSSAWSRPATALLRPWLWPQGLRLGADAKRWSQRAAAVAAAALRPDTSG